jgi:hypothetical protein
MRLGQITHELIRVNNEILRQAPVTPWRRINLTPWLEGFLFQPVQTEKLDLSNT